MRKSIIIAVIIFIIAALYLNHKDNEQDAQNYQQLRETSQRLSDEAKAKDQLKEQTEKLKQETHAKEQQLQKKDTEIIELKKQVVIKNQIKLASAQKPQAKSPAPVMTGGSKGNCGDNMYKQYIYMKESNCNTAARNPGGCFGIGQSCPASKIAHCGTDFACQDAWFSNYAVRAYGGWAQAYAAHKSKGWW